MTTRTSYPSDLTDDQWKILEPLLPPRGHRGRPATVDLREVMNAIFYQSRTGCQWRSLPAEFPNHHTVYWYFATWIDDGVFERINDELRGRLRETLGRDPHPSAASIDRPSVKTTEKDVLSQPPDHAACGRGGLERLRRCTSSS